MFWALVVKCYQICFAHLDKVRPEFLDQFPRSPAEEGMFL